MTTPPDDEPAHDVLAAEEFELPAGDPSLHVEPPHDVLAAEEFELGAADPQLHHDPVVVPPEPGAGPSAHDVLAADEFAVPAVALREAPPGDAGSRRRGRLLAGAGAVAGALVALVTVRRRRRR